MVTLTGGVAASMIKCPEPFSPPLINESLLIYVVPIHFGSVRTNLPYQGEQCLLVQRILANTQFSL